MPRLLGAMLVQESEDLTGPQSRSKIAEDVALLRRAAEWRINLQFIRPAPRPSLLLRESCSATGHSRSRLGKRKLVHAHFEPHAA